MCFGIITWQRGAQKSTIDYLLGSQTLMSQVRKMTVDEKGNLALTRMFLSLMSNRTSLFKCQLLIPLIRKALSGKLGITKIGIIIKTNYPMNFLNGMPNLFMMQTLFGLLRNPN